MVDPLCLHFSWSYSQLRRWWRCDGCGRIAIQKDHLYVLSSSPVFQKVL